MKQFFTFVLIFAMLADGCALFHEHRGRAGSPGGTAAGGTTNAPASPNAPTKPAPVNQNEPNPAARAEQQGAANLNVSTNIQSEHEANAALANSAMNGQFAGGYAQRPGGAFSGGIGTGEHGVLFWFYVALGIAFLVWLVAAIRHRVHVHREATARSGHGSRRASSR